MKTLLTALVAVFVCLGPANAATCMNHKAMMEFLSDKYNETPRVLGLVEDRGLMEIYVSEGGTWTVVMTTPQQITCIIAAGDTWEEIDLKPTGTEH